MTRHALTCGIGVLALFAVLQAASGLLAFLGRVHSPPGLKSCATQLHGLAVSPPDIAGQDARAEFFAPLLLSFLVAGSSLVLRRRQGRQRLQSSVARCAESDRQSATVTPGSRVIGIDLGTTNSAVAVIEAGSPVIIPNSEGKRTTPSVVAYSRSGEIFVGENAKRQAVTNPQNTFQSVKRFVGRRPSEVKEETRDVAYNVVSAADKVQLDCPQLNKRLAPEEISAKVLRKLTEDAGRYLGEKVTKAVITVPAYFNDAQRQATKDAGRIAGLEVLRIINEPTAAALAYGLDKRGNETIMVFDLGGGTFDVSVLEVGDGVVEVLATNGDTRLGGDDFDRKIVEWLASEFGRKERVDLLKDKQALQRLTEAAEKAKIDLSAAAEARISLPFITANASGPKHLEETLTRAKFDKFAEDLVQRCRRPCEQALKDANLKAGDVDEVVLVGGSTRIPAIQELAKSLGSGRPLNQSVNPDEVVAIGAAIQAGVLSGEVTGLVLLDVTPLSLGVETLGGVCTNLIPRNTTIPAKKTEVFSTAVDAQPLVEIAVLQGERQFARDNKMLGTFRLEGLPPAPRGVPQIEVVFDIDANGILDVSAKDRGTGKQQHITISGSSTLSADDVDMMVRDAEANAAADAKRKALVEVRNDAEAMSYQAEKQLRDFGEQVPQDLRESIETKAAALREAAASAEEDHLKRLSDELRGELVRIGEMVYAAANAAPSAEADVIDIEQGFPPE